MCKCSLCARGNMAGCLVKSIKCNHQIHLKKAKKPSKALQFSVVRSESLFKWKTPLMVVIIVINSKSLKMIPVHILEIIDLHQSATNPMLMLCLWYCCWPNICHYRCVVWASHAYNPNCCLYFHSMHHPQQAHNPLRSTKIIIIWLHFIFIWNPKLMIYHMYFIILPLVRLVDYFGTSYLDHYKQLYTQGSKYLLFSFHFYFLRFHQMEQGSSIWPFNIVNRIFISQVQCQCKF